MPPAASPTQNTISNFGTVNTVVTVSGSGTNSITNGRGGVIQQGLNVTGNPQSTVANFGTVNGTINMSGTGGVFNEGALNGGTAINFSSGPGPFTLTLAPGYSISGTVLGTGNDTFQLGDPVIGSSLGARFDRVLAVYSNAILALRGRLAWAHDWVSDPTLTPLFQTLPGASFIVNGATPARDSALASAGAEYRLANGITLLAKFDGEFASRSSTYAGTGAMRYAW